MSLVKSITCPTRSDPLTRRAYAVDASIFEIEPQLIALPRTKEELISLVKTAHEFEVPITPRGAATSTTGAALGEGIVIDLAAHFNKILEINIEEEWVRVEPGVVLDQLNEALAPHGYRFGPDVSTSNRATLGGMIANNASGAHSLRHGSTSDNLLEVELLLANGTLISLGPTSDGPLEQSLRELHDEYRDEIAQNWPKLHRQVAGYNLPSIPKGNFAKLIAGSEGSLGILTEAKLHIVKKPSQTALSVFFFDSLYDATDKVKDLLPHNPYAIELVDETTLSLGRLSPLTEGKLDWIEGDPKALLIVEWDTTPPIPNTITDPTTISHVWTLRKAGLGLLLSRRTHARAVSFLEDVAVPPDVLTPFLRELNALYEECDLDVGIFGHAGEGCLHIRPYLDLRHAADQETMISLMLKAASLLKQYGGTHTGEHGEGRIRSWLTPHIFSEKLAEAFAKVKALFDPDGRMNPTIVVGGEKPLHNLRYHTTVFHPDTFLDFTKEGGLPFAADMCNGNGACRKKEGLMCPSFHATGDEYQTTRARAQAFRALFSGHLPPDAFTSKELHDILDHCISCKGCKTECPSQVDMAKMKAEFLHTYHQQHGPRLRDRIFASIGQLAMLPTPPKWLCRLLGITTERPLPKKAKRRFSKMDLPPTQGRKVVLLNDTFNEFYHPEIGVDAHAVLAHLGYEVIVPPYTCCGRPAFTKGLLPKAKEQAQTLLDRLLPYAQQKIPIIGLEPSCILTLKDDYPSLIPSTDAETLASVCLTFDELIARHKEELPPLSGNVHVHCHQKALVGTETLPGLNPIPSTCCGMAGSFGYEAEHYAFSLKIGESSLFPKVRALDSEAPLIANGTSCRTQIEEGCGRTPLHLAQFLRKKLDI